MLYFYTPRSFRGRLGFGGRKAHVAGERMEVVGTVYEIDTVCVSFLPQDEWK